jgi:hypothetical protein
MSRVYAKEFSEISSALMENTELREAVLKLIDEQPVPGKVTEGEDRLARFKEVLRQLIRGEISLTEAYYRTETGLPRASSIYAINNRVFASGWAERLVRTQFSRFYNQAVLEQLISEGQTQCFVPHSSEEDRGSKCSMNLAGASHDINVLYNRLIESYARGNWSSDLKIPEHPHCTHVVAPVS